MRGNRPRRRVQRAVMTAEDLRARADVGHLDGACADVLELAARRPAKEFAARYHERRTIPGLLPKIEAAVTYLTEVRRHLKERIR
jgi:hypothetical protein